MTDAQFTVPGCVRRAARLGPCWLLAVALMGMIPADHAQAAESDQRLTAEQKKAAIVVEALSFPTPGEFFSALGKTGTIAWHAAGRHTTPPNAQSRSLLALNLGALAADACLAVEKQSPQEVRNITRDALELAMRLNASEHLMARGRSLTAFAERNEWNPLREELEATLNEIRLSLIAQRDEGLALLMLTGAWLRAAHVGALALLARHEQASTTLLMQEGLAREIVKRLEALHPFVGKDPWAQCALRWTNQVADLMVPLPGEDTLSLARVELISRHAGSALECIKAAALPEEQNPDPLNQPENNPDKPIPDSGLQQLQHEPAVGLQAMPKPDKGSHSPDQRLKKWDAWEPEPDDVVVARQRALSVAGGLVNEGFRLRDAYWPGVAEPGRPLFARIWLWGGNSCWLVVAGARKVPLGLEVYSPAGLKVPSARWSAQGVEARGFLAAVTGFYFVRVTAAPEGEAVVFCLVSAMR